MQGYGKFNHAPIKKEIKFTIPKTVGLEKGYGK